MVGNVQKNTVDRLQNPPETGLVKHSVQTDEMMGFLNMLNSGNQAKAWKEVIPELNEQEFEELSQSMSDILTSDFFNHKMNELHTLDDFKTFIKGKISNALLDQVDGVYKIYDSFYKDNLKTLKDYTRTLEKTFNNQGKDTFEKMAQFYGLENASEHQTKAYVLVGIGSSGCSLSGNKQSFQLSILKTPLHGITEEITKKDVSKLFHETAHGIFEDSGSEKLLNDYIDSNPDNPISQLMEDKPHLKRHETDDPKLMINEFMTTAFQKIFTHDALQKETSYGDPTIAIMAEKLVPQIREAISNGETFNEDFIKKVEKTFVEAVPEIEKEIAQKQEEMTAKKVGEKFLRTVFGQNGMELTGAFWGNPDNLKALKSMLPSFKGLDPNQDINEEFIEKVKKEHPAEFAAITSSSGKDNAKKEGKNSLLSTLSEATKDGKSDSRNETKELQPTTKKKTTFPKWLQNPSWLWHRSQNTEK